MVVTTLVDRTRVGIRGLYLGILIDLLQELPLLTAWKLVDLLFKSGSVEVKDVV